MNKNLINMKDCTYFMKLLEYVRKTFVTFAISENPIAIVCKF